MKRRRVLALAGSAATSAVLAGCTGGSGTGVTDDEPRGDGSVTDGITTGGGTDGREPDGSTAGTVERGGTDETTDGTHGDPTDGEAIPLRVAAANATDTDRTVEVRVTHVEDPECRYGRPACAAPTRQETAFDRSFDLGPGRTATAEGWTERVEGVVDLYEVTATAGDASRTLSGVEAGAESVMGEAFDPADYDFRVRDAAYRIDVVLEEGGIRVEVAESDGRDGAGSG